MSAIPWSAAREYRLRRRITLLWLGVWIGLLGGLFLLGGARIYRQLYAYAGMTWGAGLFLFYKLNQARAELGDEMGRLPNGQFHEGSGMLANKPRSTANLTHWCNHTQHPSSPHKDCPRFTCDCGKPHLWANAQWIPNFDTDLEDNVNDGPSAPLSPGAAIQIDPGGGRFVILCPCGVGHFKLKA